MSQQKSEFMQWCDELEANGYHILWGSGQAPTELQGFLPAGEVFYFRARHTTARIEIGVDNPDASKWSEVFSKVFYTRSQEADGDNDQEYSWLDAREARAIFEDLLRAYEESEMHLVALVKPTPERLTVLKNMLMHDLVS